MQERIDEALVLESSEEEEPPFKKRKASKSKRKQKETSSEEDEEERKKKEVARKNLTNIYLKYPDLNTLEVDEAFQKVNEMGDEEVIRTLERCKAKMNLSLPGHASNGILGLVGLILDQIFGVSGLGRDFIEDPELPSLLACYLPFTDSDLSIPAQIFYRMSDCVAKKKK